MQADDYAQQLKTVEELVRAGETGRARAILSALSPSEVPRMWLRLFANLCRRTDLIAAGLKLMAPLIQLRDGKWQTTATASELAEYGALLQKTGALREALWILKKAESPQTPEAYLYQAFCHMNLWEHEEAMRLLLQHGQSESRPYQRLVGQVNMAACLVALGKVSEALERLSANLAIAGQEKFTRLEANCLELRAQVYIQSGNLEKAKQGLVAASARMQQTEASDYFYIQKWLSIIEGLKNRDASPILALREKAISLKQWESVRDADRFILKVVRDHTRFYHLLFGTPFHRFRQKILQENNVIHIPEQLLIGHPDHPTLDIRSGQISGRTFLSSHPSKTTHRLLDIFTRDLYRPAALGRVFAELFPDEYFDCNSSFHRVHQAIYRLRDWIGREDLPVRIAENAGSYSLQILGDLSLQLPFERQTIESNNLRTEQLRQRFLTEKFSSQEAAQALNVSLSSSKALLRWSLEQGLVAKEGAGPSTRYFFVALSKSDSRAAA